MSDFTTNLGNKTEDGHSARVGTLPQPLPSLKAFISAPVSVDTSVLRRELEKRGITPFELDELDPEGRSIAELLEVGIRQADLVVAVMTGRASDNNVAFELGYATGMKKRVLAIVPPEGDWPVPFDLKGFPFFRAHPDNEVAIEFWLDLILKAPRRRGHDHLDRSRRTEPLGPFADELLDKIHNAGGGLDERAIAEIVRRAIEASDIHPVYESPPIGSSDRGADMAIWSDDFEPWLGNPLLVQMKANIRSRSELAAAVGHLARVLDRTPDGWGLLVFQGEDLDLAGLELANSRVLVLPIEGFLELLKVRGLGDVLRRLRNSRVHGKG